jgi:protease I
MDQQIIPIYLGLKTIQGFSAATIQKGYVMNRLLISIVLCTCILSCAQNTPKVLLFMRNAQSSGDLEYMLKKEVGVMKDTLERSGYKVVIATLDGSSISAGSTTAKADIKLSEAAVADYAGFILPCLAVPSYPAPPEISPEAIALVKGAISEGKPVAAQTGSVWTLAKAGVLKGKKYTYAFAEKSPLFEGATFAGTGVVTDGLVITSGICPYMALKSKTNDGTEQLAIALVAAMKARK